MRREVASGIMLTLLIISVSTFAFSIQPVRAEPTTIIVPDDFLTIQEAINHANDGASIFVRADTYHENVVVNKSVSLIGDDENSIINGLRNGHTVVIEADDVTLVGFTVTNSSLLQTPFEGPYSGIHVLSDNCNISKNHITQSYYGLWGQDSSNTVIGRNYVTSNKLGVTLDFSLNNTIHQNHIASNDWSGIMLDDSLNNTIAENNITDNKIRGIELWDSTYNTITGNNMTNNESGYSVLLKRSSNNNVSRNNMADNEYGIYIDESSNNTLSENIMKGNRYSFGVFGWGALSHYVQSIDVSNLVNGKPVYYLINQKDLVVDSSTHPQVGYLALINSTNVVVEDLTLTNNSQGLLLAYTNHSRIENNSVAYNNFGIQLAANSLNNTITQNNVAYNHYGITVSPPNNTVHGNQISNNDRIGIALGWRSDRTIVCGNNVTNNGWVTGMTGSWAGFKIYYSSDGAFYHNNFINNKKHVISEASTNVWDSGYPSGGNYWSDYTAKGGYDADNDGIGDIPYVVDAFNQDGYPLMNPWDTAPPVANAGPDQTLYEDTLMGFDGSGSSDNVGIVSYVWTFVDVAPQVLSGENPTYTFTTPGIFTVTLDVSDEAGNHAKDTVTITVLSLTSEDLIQNLIVTIDTWNLLKGTENSFTSKLNGALHLLDKGNENGAKHKLMDFMNQAEAQRGKKLTDDQADHLISEAQRIISLI